MRVFRRDQAATVARLREAARRLVGARDDVLAVWLFGSLARGEAGPASDADLLVVVRDDAGPFLDRGPALARYFEGLGVGCDLLVYTESELLQLREHPSLARTALTTGLLLASCGGASSIAAASGRGSR